jgi:hypothetical protein
VWDKLDQMVAHGDRPTLDKVRKLAKRHKWNENNARIEFYRWRAFVAAQAGTPAKAPTVPAMAAPGASMVHTPAYSGPDRRKAH